MSDVLCQRCRHPEHEHVATTRRDLRERPDGRAFVRERCGVTGCGCYDFFVADDLRDLIDEPWSRESGERAQRYEPDSEDDPADARTWIAHIAEEDRGQP